MKPVTTIIPVYNAAPTLERTVRSALAQTYQAHQILVIDDGSIDATASIADTLAKQNARVRVVSQENRGLSGARNRGLDEAEGDYVAPLDADDLWHPEKLARQVAALEARPDAALAYAWFRRIDEHDRVLPGSASPRVAGGVFHRHLDHNFISNGSSPLIRTEAARAIRYDESVPACEDYLFQLRLAERHAFACVPAYLTGYRLRTASMSRDVERMIRAHIAVFEKLAETASGAAATIIAERLAGFEIELVRNRGRRGDFPAAAAAAARAFGASPAAALTALGGEGRQAIERMRRPLVPPPARRFEDYAAEEPDGPWVSGRSPAREAWLAALDG